MERAFKHPPLEGKLTRPLMYQGGSDDFVGPTEDMPFPSEADGIDFEAEIAVIVDRVPMGTPAAEALRHVKLVMLANDASLRSLALVEMKTGFGWIHAKPATSFSPVAVTPDALGPAWKDGRLHLPIQVSWNGRKFGHPNAGAMGFGFHELIAHAAYSRNLSAGTIIGSGTVSNPDYRSVGSACIAERRAIELADEGHALTEYMRIGDRVRIEMFDPDGRSLFGAIDQKMVLRSPQPG
jgi:fumarylacetoacetate (FAA) hydrolase